VQLYAIHFPQFHRLAENDRFWGDGFTDWVDVRRARPCFAGHAQPRVPASGYYDLADPRTLRRQVGEARAHGLDGFCFYHYWFDGRPLLETPVEHFLAARDLDFGFCLSWANEPWSRRRDGQAHQLLLRQTQPPSRAAWAAHFDWLARAFCDPRALRVDGRPVFLIYRPDLIAPGMLDDWRERARAIGLPGLFLVATAQFGVPSLFAYDAVFRFQPFFAQQSLDEQRQGAFRRGIRPIGRMLPPAWKARLWSLAPARGPRMCDYDEVWRRILDAPPLGVPTVEGAFVDWDNTPRHGARGVVYRGATPEKLRGYLGRLLARPGALTLVNAWNEWAEGAHLEADRRWGYAWLEAIRAARRPSASWPAIPAASPA
jgi:lipopolysaccharide biosynthesis protein